MRNASLTLLGVILASCGIDRISKFFALSVFDGQGVFFYSGFAGLPTWVVIGIYIGIVFGTYFLINKRPSFLSAVASGLILGGGASNIYDRIVYGHVIDWISVGNVFVCNLADAMIVIGIFILLYSIYDRKGTINRTDRA